jgi:hypothetical protein
MGGYKPYKEFLFKISETAKVNHFNILVDLCHKNIGKNFWWYKFPQVYEVRTVCLEIRSEIFDNIQCCIGVKLGKVHKFSPRPQ